MDIKDILPLLAVLNGKNNAQTEKMQTLTKLMSGEKPDVTQIMSMVNNSRVNRDNGLKPICDIANNDILGRLIRHFENK